MSRTETLDANHNRRIVDLEVRINTLEKTVTNLMEMLIKKEMAEVEALKEQINAKL